MKTLTACILAGLSLFPITAAAAETAPSVLYVLKTESSFQTGCFGPCLCPVLMRPMQGTFHLQETSIDPLFTNYDVLDVRWAVPDSSVAITGSGTYRVGGEFAVQQQMVLDLSVGGGPVQHFDSGLVPGGGTFPAIDVRVSLHQEQACLDTVLQVIAGPTTTTSAGEAGGAVVPGIRAVTPNPFRDRALLVLSVSRPDRVSIDVFDPRGRVIRRLIGSRPMAPGAHPIAWDGKADDGSDCAAGLYFVRASLGGDRFYARVVRVR